MKIWTRGAGRAGHPASGRLLTVAVLVPVLVVGGYLAVRAGDRAGGPGRDAAAGPSGGPGAPGPDPSASTRPVPAGLPGPGNTGWRHTGVALKRVTQRVYADTPGAVYDGIDFRDGIVIRADNVTVRRSRVQCGDCPAIWLDWNVRGTVIEDVEITSVSARDRIDRAITAGRTYDTTIRRAYVHHTQRGIEYGYGTVIEDSYLDGFYNPTDAHVSAIGGESAAADFRLTVRHNWIALPPDQNDSAAFLMYGGDWGRKQGFHVVIEDNTFNGGTYCLWLGPDERVIQGTLDVRGNHFGAMYFPDCGYYGTHFLDTVKSIAALRFTWSGNRWYAPGEPRHNQVVEP